MDETPFQYIARAPNCWLLSAETTYHASKVLWDTWSAALQRMFQVKTVGPGPHFMPHDPHLTLGNTACMLAGLCIENLVKYLLIKQKPDLVLPDKIKDTVTKHGTSDLFKQAKIPLSDDEEDLVRFLEQCVRWAGKYPFPKQPNNPEAYIGGYTPEVFEAFENLRSRLLKMVTP